MKYSKIIKKGGIILGICLFLFALLFFGFLNYPARSVSNEPDYGVTFTPGQAASFGIDWRQMYADMLDDLGVRRIRITAYWNVIEPREGEYSFEELDYQMDELGARGGKAILAIGRKLPRWPECHDPSWMQGATRDQISTSLKKYLTVLVERYKNHSALGYWQVENEITFPFGVCPHPIDETMLADEIRDVRDLDRTHRIIVTDAGEWTTWFPLGLQGDILGSSLYREAWNRYLGRIPFPIGPGYYQVRADFLGKFGKEVIFTEVQTEPWGAKAIHEMTYEEMNASMPLEKFKANVSFAQRVGFDEIYLWGVEWWYLMKQTVDESYWSEAKKLFEQ